MRENKQSQKTFISSRMLNSSHTLADNQNVCRAYEKSHHAEDFGHIKINLFL